MATYMLMNSDQIVAEIDLECREADAFSTRILNTFDQTLLPFSVRHCRPGRQNEELETWLSHRLIPKSREGIGRLILEFGSNRMNMALLAHAQSCSDDYWLQKENESLRWNEISFRKNEFSNDFGDYVFRKVSSPGDGNSPDVSTNGMLRKTWRKRNGKLYLLKAGSAPHFEEPFHEVLSSEIMKVLCHVPFVTYHMGSIGKETVSVCENFLKEGMELVTAGEICRAFTRYPDETLDMHLRNCCEKLQIPGCQQFFDELRILDGLIANHDRHLGNYGFLWSVKSRRFLGPAPIYDNGASLWGDDTEIESHEIAEKECKDAVERASNKTVFSIEDLKTALNAAESLLVSAKILDSHKEVIMKNLVQRARLLSREIERAKQITKNNTHHRTADDFER